MQSTEKMDSGRKIKPLYIYLAVIVAAIIFLLVFTSNPDKEEMASNQMPQDEVHKGLNPHGGMGGPSGSNVSSEIKMKMESLKKAYEENPNDTVKAKEYADFMAMAHKPNDAIPVYENILQKDSKRTDVRFSLALIYFNKGDYKKAEEIIESVLQYDKKNLQAKYNLGAIAATKGDKEKAKRIWQDLIKENPESETAKMAEESIKSLL